MANLQSPLIKENIQQFSGRTWLLPILHNWLAHGREQMFLLTGDPGTGKSMITAWLAGYGPLPADEESQQQLLALRQQIVAAHFLQANSRNTTTLACAESLADQLSFTLPGFDEALTKALRLYGLNINVFQRIEKVEKGATVIGVKIGRINLVGLAKHDPFDLGFVQPLKQLYENGYDRPALVLIDALDEAYANDHRGRELVLLLSGLADLPQQVRILVTSRPDPRVTKHFRAARRFDLIADAADQSVDIHKYAYDWLLARSQLPEQDAQRLTDSVAEAASGIFLYAYMVLRDVIPGLQSPIDAADIQLPVGLSGLYHDFLNRELGKDEDRWFAELRPLLGLIAVARGEGLTRPQLQELLGHDPLKSLRDCHQYLSGSLNDGPFRIFHRSLTDYLLQDKDNVDYHIDAAAMHRVIVDHTFTTYRKNWQQCDSYGLTNIIDHLLASDLSREEKGRLLKSILTRGFISAIQRRRGWLYSLAEDLEKAAEVEPELVANLCYPLIFMRPPNSLVIQRALRLLVELKPYALAVNTANKPKWRALQRVVEILSGPPAEAPDSLLQKLQETEAANVRGLLALALGETGCKEVTPELVQMLKTERGEASWAAADALIALNDRRVITELVQWYQSIQHENNSATSADKQRILYTLGWMHAEEAQVLKENARTSPRDRVIGRGLDLCWLLPPDDADKVYLAERLQAILSSLPEDAQVLGPWKDEWLQKRLVRTIQHLRLVEFLPQLRELRTHIAARPPARRTGGGMNRVAKREKLIESVEEALTKLK